MALDSKHPRYSEMLEDWLLMRHSYAGERVVKEQGKLYLPPTSGMLADGMQVNSPGWNAHKAYVTRSVFPDYVKEAVETLVGVAYNKPPVFEVPDQMKPLIERATVDRESLAVLLRRITETQLTTGRLGLLLDIPAEPPPGEKPLPYIATYDAEAMLNWDAGRNDDSTLQTLNFVALNESEFERSATFEWQMVNKYRILLLGKDPKIDNEKAGAKYMWGVFRNQGGTSSAFNLAEMKSASLMGKELEEIPFVFINAKDINPNPDAPPLLGLARLCMTIYRTEADYRQSLFMQGQDTLVVIGGATGETDTLRVGAGARLDLPEGGDAKYIGVSSTGLPELRQALENDHKRAQAKGSQMLDTTSRMKESGDALQTRVAAQTVTLNQVVLAGAYGLQEILRKAAVWMGLDPMAVTVTPNTDFEDIELGGAELVQLVSAKNMGAPLSRKSLHDKMRQRGLTTMTLEEELAEIETEPPIGGDLGGHQDPGAGDGGNAPGDNNQG